MLGQIWFGLLTNLESGLNLALSESSKAQELFSFRKVWKAVVYYEGEFGKDKELGIDTKTNSQYQISEISSPPFNLKYTYSCLKKKTRENVFVIWIKQLFCFTHLHTQFFLFFKINKKTIICYEVFACQQLRKI